MAPNARFMSWRTLMAYVAPSRNGEESYKLLSAGGAPNSHRGGPSHGDATSCVKKSCQSKQ